MTDPYHGMDIATGIEISFQLHPDRICCGNKIIEDAIGHLFMGNRTVTETVHIELDRFELNHSRTRLIDQAQHCKVGVTREWTLAREFRKLNRHLIGTTRSWVVEADQLGLGNGTLAIKGRLGLLVCQRKIQESEKTLRNRGLL